MDNLTKTQHFGLYLMLIVTSVSLTLYITKPKPDLKALDLEIIKAVLKEGSDYCQKIKAKNYIARASGMDVQSGCARK